VTLTPFSACFYESKRQPLYLKETGVVFANAPFAFLALTPAVMIRFLTLVGTGLCTLLPILMIWTALCVQCCRDW